MTELRTPRLELRANPVRLWTGVLMLCALAWLLFALIVRADLSVLGSSTLGAVGAASLWVAWRMYRLGGATLVLTDAGLEILPSEQGHQGGAYEERRMIAPIEDIVRVERGAFAFKPSNGFLLTLSKEKAAPSRLWAPGLYWRFGRRVAIGGVTPAGAGKAMAEAIALRLA